VPSAAGTGYNLECSVLDPGGQRPDDRVAVCLVIGIEAERLCDQGIGACPAARRRNRSSVTGFAMVLYPAKRPGRIRQPAPAVIAQTRSAGSAKRPGRLFSRGGDQRCVTSPEPRECAERIVREDWLARGAIILRLFAQRHAGPVIDVDFLAPEELEQEPISQVVGWCFWYNCDCRLGGAALSGGAVARMRLIRPASPLGRQLCSLMGDLLPNLMKHGGEHELAAAVFPLGGYAGLNSCARFRSSGGAPGCASQQWYRKCRIDPGFIGHLGALVQS